MTDYWQNANGTWSHRYGNIQWDDELSCITDLQFAKDWQK